MQNITIMYDIIIVGGGIAGIFIGEIFSRNQYKTLIIEAKEVVCQKSSGELQGWFHTGSLYSMSYSKNEMNTFQENIKNLIQYYNVFEDMNFSINERNNHKNINGWFKERISYKFHETEKYTPYSKTYIENLNEWNLVLNKNKDTQKKTKNNFYKSYDSVMNSSKIIHDIINSYVKNNGELMLKTEFKEYHKISSNCVKIITSKGQEYV